MSLGLLPGHLARRFHQLSTNLFDAEMRSADIDLTSVQYAALVAIRDNPCIDQASLAAMIVCDRTTIGGVIDRLAEKDLVSRVVSETDRRARVLTVNEAGLKTIERAEPAMMRAQQRLVGELDHTETGELLRLLEKVVTGLGATSRTSR